MKDTMNEVVNQTSADVRDFLVQAVTAHWNRYRSALLFSTIGTYLIKKGFDTAALFQGRKLIDIISSEFSTEIKVVRSSLSAEKIGLIPKDEYEEGKDDEYFKKQDKPHVRLKKPSFIPNVIWLAFSRPLAEGYARYISTEQKLSYRDIKDKNGAESKIAGIKINKDLIIIDADNDQTKHDELIKNVEQWILENLSEVRKEGLAERPISTSASLSLGKDSVLHRMIASLTTEDLARISLPMDIVEKLLRS
jgi:hypothetical protein